MSEFLRKTTDTIHRNIVHRAITSGVAREDREIAHERALDLLETFNGKVLLRNLLRKAFTFEDPILNTNLAGIETANPFGIPAGLDKNARIYDILGDLGAGIVTVGSITKVPYEGNPRPRVFDLPINDALINRMGFPGDGTDNAEHRLKAKSNIQRNFALMISIAASKPSFERGTAIEDYLAVMQQLSSYGDGVEVNVSSPNTQGVRGLQDPDVFESLMSTLEPYFSIKPSFVKFSPDLPLEILFEDIKIALKYGVKGVSLTNTTTDPSIRENLIPETSSLEQGGISGVPLKRKALEVSHQVYQHFKNNYEIDLPIKFAGGIQNTEDAWNALTYGGATVVDVYSAFVRPNTSTPNFAYYLLRDLAEGMRLMGMDGMEGFQKLRGQHIQFLK